MATLNTPALEEKGVDLIIANEEQNLTLIVMGNEIAPMFYGIERLENLHLTVTDLSTINYELYEDEMKRPGWEVLWKAT